MADTETPIKSYSTSSIDQRTATFFTVGVGESIRICPHITDPPATADNNSTSGSVRGFILSNTEIGELIEDPKSEICVIYKHKKSGKQLLIYPTGGLSKRIFYAVLTGIVPHDHASVYQGGPAFATYFSDIDSSQTEEGNEQTP